MTEQMTISVPISDQEEADLLQKGLADPVCRAFVKISVVLGGIEQEEDRERIVEASCILLDIPYATVRRRR
jgi:hypothetical protein